MILIVGDDWAVGEWNPLNYSVHNGLGQFLNEKSYNTINLGRAKNSNIESINDLSFFLTANLHIGEKITHIFFFQTDWTKDLPFMTNSEIVSDLSFGYDNFKDRIISRIYMRLSNMALSSGLKIYLIGGNSDTIWLEKFSEEYPGLNIACQSLTNLVVNQKHNTVDPIFSVFDNKTKKSTALLRDYLSVADTTKLQQDIEIGNRRLSIWETNKEFWSSNKCPNSKSHKLLFDFLISARII